MSKAFWSSHSIKASPDKSPNKQGLGKKDPPVSAQPNMASDDADNTPKPRRAPKSPSNRYSR